MPRNVWSPKRERQYEHVKDSLLERGKGEKLAEEIAARTVNKDRAQHGETREASRSSLDDISPERRGGLRSHKGEGGRTYDQLYNEARAHGIKGRSSMSKAQLEAALRR
jgi:plasmid stabilization system protein ParE